VIVDIAEVIKAIIAVISLKLVKIQAINIPIIQAKEIKNKSLNIKTSQKNI
jgi:hypothetical protein